MSENFSGKIDKYGLLIDFTKCRSVNITHRWECENAGTYLGGIDENGHERKDNYVPDYDEDSVMFKYNKDCDILVRHSGYDSQHTVSAKEALAEIEGHLDCQVTDANYSMSICDENGKRHSIDAAKLYEKAQNANKTANFHNRYAAAQAISVPESSESENDFSLCD